MSFVDAGHGIAAGYGAFAAVTQDGEQWHKRRFGFGDATFYGAVMVDPRTAFVVGSSGEIRVTTNGGVNWSKQESGTRAELASVFFVNE